MDDKISAIKNFPQPQNGTPWCNGSTLGSQPRGPGFDPQAERKNLGGFSNTPTVSSYATSGKEL